MPKEIKKVRGTARIYDDDSLDFTPQKEGNPVQKDVKKVRRSVFNTTNGEKASSYVMHLKTKRAKRNVQPLSGLLYALIRVQSATSEAFCNCRFRCLAPVRWRHSSRVAGWGVQAHCGRHGA